MRRLPIPAVPGQDSPSREAPLRPSDKQSRKPSDKAVRKPSDKQGKP